MAGTRYLYKHMSTGCKTNFQFLQKGETPLKTACERILWLKFTTAIVVDIKNSYTVPVIVYHNLITDFPSIEKAHKKWTVIRPKHVREKNKNRKSLEWKLINFIGVFHQLVYLHCVSAVFMACMYVHARTDTYTQFQEVEDKERNKFYEQPMK